MFTWVYHLAKSLFGAAFPGAVPKDRHKKDGVGTMPEKNSPTLHCKDCHKAIPEREKHLYQTHFCRCSECWAKAPHQKRIRNALLHYTQ